MRSNLACFFNTLRELRVQNNRKIPWFQYINMFRILSDSKQVVTLREKVTKDEIIDKYLRVYHWYGTKNKIISFNNWPINYYVSFLRFTIENINISIPYSIWIKRWWMYDFWLIWGYFFAFWTNPKSKL